MKSDFCLIFKMLMTSLLHLSRDFFKRNQKREIEGMTDWSNQRDFSPDRRPCALWKLVNIESFYPELCYLQ